MQNLVINDGNLKARSLTEDDLSYLVKWLFDEYQVPDTGDVVYAMDQFIGVPELWGVGIGTRYVRMVTDWLVRERKVAAVVMDPRKNNPRAVRCYQKAGYEIITELPAHELHEGTFEDCYLMRYMTS